MLSLADDIKSTANDFELATNEYTKALGLNVTFKCFSQLTALQTLSKYLPDAYAEHYGFGFSVQGSMQRKELLELTRLIKEFHEQMGQLKNPFKRAVLGCELEDLQSQWIEAEEKWFFAKWLGKRSVKKVFGKNLGKKIQAENILTDFDYLISARQLQEKISKYQHLSTAIGKYWNGVDSDVIWIGKVCHWLDRVLSAISKVSDTAEQAITNKQQIAQWVVDQNELLEASAPIDVKGQVYSHQFNAYKEISRRLNATIDTQSEDVFKAAGENNYFQQVVERCNAWSSHKNKLRYWCAWRKVRQDAISVGLTPLVQGIEKSHTSTTLSVKELLRVNYSRWWVNAVVDHDEVLRNFIPAEHRQKIEAFHQLDADFMVLTQQYVRAMLAKGIPKTKNIKKGSDWGILAREIQKKTRHMPLRQLMEKMPDVISKLTPCVMMSPMSIAQYLPANSKAFDVVIFDEASQITVPDAIGAVARAKQAIVVGDPKQLSPTSFFSRKSAEDDEYDDDFDEDMESILDECLAANIPCINLNWHYRSRCESLITFSNHKYYDGKLVTFPNNDTKGMSVFYHPVDSVYKEGQLRVNRGEAEAIIEDVVAKLRQPGFKKSIGIVTFNTDQQKLRLFSFWREGIIH